MGTPHTHTFLKKKREKLETIKSFGLGIILFALLHSELLSVPSLSCLMGSCTPTIKTGNNFIVSAVGASKWTTASLRQQLLLKWRKESRPPEDIGDLYDLFAIFFSN